MGIFGEKVEPHPTPEKALINIPGLTISDLTTLIKRAVDYGEQVAPVRGFDRYYLGEIGGFKYNFHHWHDAVLGSSYRLRDQAALWAIEFRSSSKRPDGACRNGPYIMTPLITVTEKVCFDFYLRGDKEQFKHDMSKLKLFL